MDFEEEHFKVVRFVLSFSFGKEKIICGPLFLDDFSQDLLPINKVAENLHKSER